MSENDEVAKLNSVKLVYNEKSKRIVANLITKVDGVKVTSKTIDNIKVIKVLIDALVKQSKLSVAELVDNGIINIDERLLNKGVVILNNKEYKKYIFDKDAGDFVLTKLTRTEQKEFGIREDFGIEPKDPIERVADDSPFVRIDKEVADDSPFVRIDTEVAEEKPVEVVVERDEPREDEVRVVFARPKEDVEEHIEVPAEDIVKEEPEKVTVFNTNTDMHLLYEITEMIQRLNPAADIRVAKFKVDPNASYRFYSSVPLEKLVLPAGYRVCADNSRWITNVNATNPDDAVYFLVEDLSKADESTLIPSIKEYIFATPEVETKKEEERVVFTEGENKVAGVKNLKISKKALALGAAIVLIVTGAIYDAYEKYKYNSEEATRTKISEDFKDEPAQDYSDTYVTPVESSSYDTYVTPVESSSYDKYNGVYSDADIIQIINNMCISYGQCNFYELMPDTEKSSMKVINNARNEALIDNSKLTALVEEYAKYIIDGGLWFGDEIIKGYDYLSPLSKYTVLASGETILQYCYDHGYNCSYDNGYRTYTFNQLIDEYDTRVRDVTPEVLNNGRRY